MKIGIVTFCEAVNYGAYLQAFALGEYLKQNNNSVFYIKTNSLKALYWKFHNLYSYHIDRLSFRNKFRRNWKKAQKKLKKTRIQSDYDLIIIGSDEMWQLKGKTFSPLPIYFGIGLSAKKIITYAVCSNGTTKEDIEKYSFIKKGLERLSAISVRDVMTKNIYKDIIEKKIYQHIDPTFLIDLRRYAEIPTIKEYILVYTYGFSEEQIEFAQNYSRKTGLPLVSVGNVFNWCNMCFPASPFEVLGYFSCADYILTDTFHGVVLSTHFQKEFLCFSSGKEKIEAFLQEMDLTDRSVDNNSYHNTEQLINYKKFNERINKKRKDAFEYLDNFAH